jgi:hypothetical protein
MIWLVTVFISGYRIFSFFVTLHGHDQLGVTRSGGLLGRYEH